MIELTKSISQMRFGYLSDEDRSTSLLLAVSDTPLFAEIDFSCMNVNAFVCAAFNSVIEMPGNHNPLLIYGNTFRARKQLLVKIGKAIVRFSPNFMPYYISASRLASLISTSRNFPNEIIEGIKNIDLLIVEEIQNISCNFIQMTAILEIFSILIAQKTQILLSGGSLFLRNRFVASLEAKFKIFLKVDLDPIET